jgi:hypothetical protein
MQLIDAPQALNCPAINQMLHRNYQERTAGRFTTWKKASASAEEDAGLLLVTGI